MIKLATVDGRTCAYEDNKFIGFWDGVRLFGVDRKGYSVEIGNIDHRNEIIPALTEWRNSQ